MIDRCHSDEWLTFSCHTANLTIHNGLLAIVRFTCLRFELINIDLHCVSLTNIVCH